MININSILIIVIIVVILFSNKKLKSKENFSVSKKCNYYKKILNNEELKNLKNGQKTMTEMLKILNEICRKNGLYYWVTGGTLIGTIRHKGWIPHDADIDLAMIEDDYLIFREKIIEEFKKDKFKNKYWLQDEDTDKFYKKYKNPIIKAKLRSLEYSYIDDKDNSIHNGVQIDIFVFKKKLDKLIIHPPLKTIKKYLNKRKKNPSLPKIPEPLNDITNYKYKDIFPLKEFNFENIKVFVPNTYKLILKKTWGGYPPPFLDKCKRFPHEGRIGKTEDWTKKKYSHLYNKN